MNFMGLWQWPAMAVNVDPVSGLVSQSDTAFACGFSNARIGSKFADRPWDNKLLRHFETKLRSQFLCDGLKFWPLAFFAGESFRVMLVLVSSSDFGFQPALRIWDVVSMQGTCVLDRNRLAGHFAFTVGQGLRDRVLFLHEGTQKICGLHITHTHIYIINIYIHIHRHST